MKLKRFVFLVAASLAATACSTLVSESPSQEYGPESELSKSRSGVVMYNPSGMKELVDMRREDAYKRIVDFCGSRKYEIVKEETVPIEKAGLAKESISTFAASNVHQMHFVCK